MVHQAVEPEEIAVEGGERSGVGRRDVGDEAVDAKVSWLRGSRWETAGREARCLRSGGAPKPFTASFILNIPFL
jgi:hypothetical protein